ncbi:hypothetical protein C7212DRAFT_342125 [Tuber magnatum]|uniref:Uncharacterized protein n=1 Tax=Tuber magnatum TaxID=42249 RepID=A0A317T110_9PEZI|nr:hypothetical protein C7212DRAFT_342125 [Tuber magnatum]
MVLHKNKWDRKATKAHERKLKAAGRVVDGAAGSAKAKEEKGVKDGGPVLGAPPAGGEVRGKEKEGEAVVGCQSGSEYNEQSGSDEGDSAAFRKRTLQNNAWRYEEEEEIPGTVPVTEDPEPDYARLTIGKEVDFSHPASSIAAKNNAPPPIEDVDEEFLRESFLASCTFSSTSVPSSSRARRDSDKGGGDKTRRVVRVPKSQFVDVTERISKQTAAEAFRQRFGARKARSRPELEEEEAEAEGEEEGDDLDSFLEGLDRVRDGANAASGTFTATSSSTPRIATTGGGVPVPGGPAAESREISSGLGRSSRPPKKDDKDDEWLDAMLGGR